MEQYCSSLSPIGQTAGTHTTYRQGQLEPRSPAPRWCTDRGTNIPTRSSPFAAADADPILPLLAPRSTSITEKQTAPFGDLSLGQASIAPLPLIAPTVVNMSVTSITSLLSAATTASSPTPTPTGNRAPSQGGVIEGANPTVYNPKDPLTIFIIQVRSQAGPRILRI